MPDDFLHGLETGVLYRNPAPHVRSIHGYFPSVAVLPDGQMLATAMVAEAFEAVNARVELFRSANGGTTWETAGHVAHDIDGQLISESARITALPDGRALILLHRHDRSARPHDGLANAKTLGFVPTEFATMESADAGRSWTQPRLIEPPLEGPSFELCSPITVLRDGRWILPTSTWRGWDGRLPNGNRMIAFLSEDQGQTWPAYWNVFHHPADQVLFWESKIVELADGMLIAIAWAYDEPSAKDLPNQFSVSRDGGQTWSLPESTGLIGQTMTPFVLDDDRLLVVYRRMDISGLWAQTARLKDGRWVNEQSQPLWGGGQTGLTGSSAAAVQNFNVLRFGAPCLARLPDGRVFVAFWCYEDCVGMIRWLCFHIDRQ